MPKGEARNVNRQFNAERDKINRESDRFGNEIWGRLPAAQDRNKQTWDKVFKGYGDILDDPNYGVKRGGGSGAGKYEAMFNQLAQGGGISPEDMKRMRGNMIFDEPGYSSGDIQNIRQQSQRMIPTFYQNMRNEMERMNRVQGGGLPSYGASEGRMARDQARGSADMALDTEVKLKDKINEDRYTRGQAIAQMEQALQELLSRNKIAGMQGAFSAQQAGAADDRFYSGLESQNRMGSLEGLRGLRQEVPGEEFGLYNFLLQNQGQRGQLTGHNLDSYAQYNPNVSTWDRVAQMGGAIAPFISAFTGMPMGMGGGGQRQQQRQQQYGGAANDMANTAIGAAGIPGQMFGGPAGAYWQYLVGR